MRGRNIVSVVEMKQGEIARSLRSKYVDKITRVVDSSSLGNTAFNGEVSACGQLVVMDTL